MNWWQQWKWLYENGIGGYERSLSFRNGKSAMYNLANYSKPVAISRFYCKDNCSDIIMGELPIRRNWIEKL